MYNNNNNHNKLLFSILYYVKKFKIIQIQIIQTHTLIKLYTKMSGKILNKYRKPHMCTCLKYKLIDLKILK